MHDIKWVQLQLRAMHRTDIWQKIVWLGILFNHINQSFGLLTIIIEPWWEYTPCCPDQGSWSWMSCSAQVGVNATIKMKQQKWKIHDGRILLAALKSANIYHKSFEGIKLLTTVSAYLLEHCKTPLLGLYSNFCGNSYQNRRSKSSMHGVSALV